MGTELKGGINSVGLCDWLSDQQFLRRKTVHERWPKQWAKSLNSALCWREDFALGREYLGRGRRKFDSLRCS